MSDTKREFKDLIRFEPYEYLNSEITAMDSRKRQVQKAGRIISIKA